MPLHYLEIVTRDVAGVCAAYAASLGLAFGEPVAELGGARVAAQVSGGLLGVRAPMHTAELPVVRPYWRVEDIDVALAAVVAAGGVVAMQPTEIAGRGRFAIYLQGGNDHGLWQV